jgi:hypothetical protein
MCRPTVPVGRARVLAPDVDGEEFEKAPGVREFALSRIISNPKNRPLHGDLILAIALNFARHRKSRKRRNTMRQNQINKRLRRLAVVASSFLFLAAGQAAWADSSCAGFLAGKTSAVTPPWGGYNIELTLHREDVKWVSYSKGTLSPNGDGSFSGSANQLFSDRFASSQPFDNSQADQLSLRLSPTGFLSAHSITWNFDTGWDLSCHGSTLTTYVPSFGVLTLTFRDVFYTIF